MRDTRRKRGRERTNRSARHTDPDGARDRTTTTRSVVAVRREISGRDRRAQGVVGVGNVWRRDSCEGHEVSFTSSTNVFLGHDVDHREEIRRDRPCARRGRRPRPHDSPRRRQAQAHARARSDPALIDALSSARTVTNEEGTVAAATATANEANAATMRTATCIRAARGSASSHGDRSSASSRALGAQRAVSSRQRSASRFRRG